MEVDGLGRRRRIGILLITCTGLFVVGLDLTVVNVALPSIGKDLRSSVAGLQWAVDAYTVVLAALFILCGSAGDRLGRRRMFLVGLAVFSAGSLACSLAPSVGFLVAARIAQAVGGSMLNPVAMAIISNTFTGPGERAQAVGVRGSVFGISLALGPIVGGTIVSAIGWRSIFLINIPIGIVAFVLTMRYVPESKAPRPRSFDPAGQVLVAVLLGALTYGVIEAPSLGWGSPGILASFTAAGAALVAFLRYEPRRAEPLIDLRFFRSIPFSSATAISVCCFASFGGFLFLTTLYLQEVRGLSPLRAGLATLPMALMAMPASLVSGRIVARRGHRLPLVTSGACCAIACAMLAGMTPTTGYPWLFASYVIFGLGFGVVNAPITDTAVSGMPLAQAGVAAAVASTSRQVGQTLGVAVAGAIVASGSTRNGLTSASRPAWWILAACGAVALLLGFVGTARRARESALRTAAALNPEALVEYTRST
jgi:EmrB/QacA subfamily drug resistance transporter